jgi:hypothetical protein
LYSIPLPWFSPENKSHGYGSASGAALGFPCSAAAAAAAAAAGKGYGSATAEKQQENGIQRVGSATAAKGLFCLFLLLCAFKDLKAQSNKKDFVSAVIGQGLL